MGDKQFRGVAKDGMGTIRFLGGIRKDLFIKITLNWGHIPDDDEFRHCYDYDENTKKKIPNMMKYLKMLISTGFVATPKLGKKHLSKWMEFREKKLDASKNKKFMKKLEKDLTYVFQATTWRLGTTAVLATQARNEKIKTDGPYFSDGAIGSVSNRVKPRWVSGAKK